jgi:putative ABC transport system permease protein
MPALYRASLGYLLRHPWQLALALLGICIGVAVIVAVDLATESSRKAFSLSMETLTGKATHQVIGGPRGIEESLYVQLRVKHGLRSMAPVAEGPVRINGVDVRLLGIDLFAERQIRSFSLDVTADAKAANGASVTSVENLFGSLLTEPGAALMSTETATMLGLQTGQAFDVEAGGKRFRGSLLGQIGGDPSLLLGELVVVDIAVAQQWLNMAGKLSRIDVRIPAAEPGRREVLENLLPAGTQLLDASSRTRSMTEMSTAFMTNLSAMSLLALLVGLFLIYNSVSFAVLQRRGLIGVLRALGVTRAQTFSLILAEGLALGLVGATAGVLLGIWLGDYLLVLVSRSINDLYFRVTVTDVSISLFTLVKGLLAGLGATLVSAVIPAIEAASYPPRLALSRSVIERRGRQTVPLLALSGVALGLAALFLLNISGSHLVAGLTAVFMLILGFALCVPLAVRIMTFLLAPLAGKLGGTGARLAVSGIEANLSRTGVAIVALAVAVSATIGVSVMVESFRGSVSTWLDRTLQSDLYVAASGAPLDPKLITELVQTQGVAAYSSSRRVWLENPQGRLRLFVLQLAPGRYPGSEILDAEPAQAWNGFEHESGVMISEPLAFRRGLGAGDTISLVTDSGERAFDIVGTFRSYDVNGGAVLISRSSYDRFWDDPAIDSIGLTLVAGAESADVMSRLQAIAQNRQPLVMRSDAEIRELSLRVFDRTFIITDVLYWLATGVAFIGILGAMLALQMERARELAVMRALGMTPFQLGGMVTTQTAVIGLFSGLAAVPLGLVMAWMLIEVINRRAFGWRMDILLSWQVLAVAIAFSVVAASMAGIYPSWRAASSSPALAMREE